MNRLKSFIFRLNGFRLSLIVALVFLVGHVLIEARAGGSGFFSEHGFLYRMEFAALDTKMQARGNIPFDPKVIVAKEDEKSIDRFGLLPWNRTRIAELIDALTLEGAKVIGFDIIYSDIDKNSTYLELKHFKDFYDEAGLYRPVQPATLGLATDKVKEAYEKLETLQKKSAQLAPLVADLKQSKDALASYEENAARFYEQMTAGSKNISPDEALANAIRRSKRVVEGYFTFASAAETQALTPAQLEQNFDRVKKAGVTEVFTISPTAQGNGFVTRPADTPVEKLHLHDVAGVQAPLPLIAEASNYFGLFNVEPDPDGRFRRETLLQRKGNVLLPSLSLLCVALYYGGGFYPILSDLSDGLQGVSINNDSSSTVPVIPTTERGFMLINYYGNPETVIPSYSVVDIIDHKLPPGTLKDKIVLVGATAIGTFDSRSTPFSPATPGVFIHASAIQNMLDWNFLQRWPGFAFVEGLLFLLIAIILGLVIPKIRISLGLGFTAAMLVALVAGDLFFVFGHGQWMRTVAPILEIITIFVAITIYRYLTEEREKRVVRNAFQFYLTKSVVDAVLKDTSRLKLGGEKKELTVLFSDIRGFTTISERLSPEDLVHLLNSYLTPMTDLVFHHEGTLDKYMGDAIMAVFGAPVDQPDHATRACLTALDMMEELVRLQAKWRHEGLPEIDIGIGMNSGPMVVGNMGSAMRFDYTVMGDNVNLGSRLEGINKEYGTNIIISEYTHELVKNDVYVRELDAVRVKGKKEPVRIFELRGKGKPPAAEVEFVQMFEGGLAHYRGQRWDEAIAVFQRCLSAKETDYCSKKYIDRCRSMAEEPPGEGWDGVYTMKTK